jgi:hypothetical protein
MRRVTASYSSTVLSLNAFAMTDTELKLSVAARSRVQQQSIEACELRVTTWT